MAQVKLKPTTVDNVLVAMKNDTGSARIDEYFFEIGEINVNDLYQQAFKKNCIVTVTRVNDKISKLTFTNALT